MKATGIVRRIDDLGRVVIPKEIRRTMRIREGDPSQITLTLFDRFCVAICDLNKRIEELKWNTKIDRNMCGFNVEKSKNMCYNELIS